VPPSEGYGTTNGALHGFQDHAHGTTNSTIRQVSERGFASDEPPSAYSQCSLQVVIGSLKLADLNSRSYGDEAAWAAASVFFVSIITSYLAVRNNNQREWQLVVADYAFLLGLVALMASVCIAAVSI